ncbi:MAG: acetoacetate--CoA ligase [Pseudomonadales bacterium]
MTQALWIPGEQRIRQSQLHQFQLQLQRSYGLAFDSYRQLHQWSIDHRAEFWASVAAFCQLNFSTPPTDILLDGDKLPGARWFVGAKMNFAENLLRRRDEKTALVSLLENGQRRELSYAGLYRQVEQLAARLRQWGVVPGDRVAGFMPNIIETTVAMLAASSVGAVWSSCSPDFGINGVIDRFGQIEPKVLFACDGYFYNGKTIDTLPRVAAIREKIDSIEHLIIVPVVNSEPDITGLASTVLFEQALVKENTPPLSFEQLPFDHPLYIMYSSGTTGVPKCIVHGAGGTLLQHAKEHALHSDVGEQDVLFYFTTCGWMMWNWLVSGLARGCTVVLYDGSPFAKEGTLLLDAIDSEQISVFGTSARFIAALEKDGHKPRESHRLDSLKTILSTGSPLSHESFDYVYRDIKADLCLSSICGGTDIMSCFVLGNPTLPVYKGEIQCLGLGMAVEIRNDVGEAVIGEKGELVCSKAFPSCPICFWNDAQGEKFNHAYFDLYDNVWAHGDYGEITANGGVVIHGRSDAVLNPGGVRIGTAEIYRQVEKVDSVVDSVVIGQQWQDDVRVILFVVLKDGVVLTEQLEQEIRQTIRSNTTPRHVPEKIIAVNDIPRTISGKIVELAVRNTVHGQAVKNIDALANPEALALFRDLPALKS